MPELRVVYMMHMEEEIQRRAKKKDTGFILSGRWKKFVRKQNGFSIYAVNGEWIRNNLSIFFGHGGHGLVHEFIPLDEIWMSTRHYKGCGCNNKKTDGQKISQEFFDSSVVHEITEFRAMERGKSFLEAHERALYKEMKLGLLPDPYTEVGPEDDKNGKS